MRDIMIRFEGRDPVHISDCLKCKWCGETLFPGSDYYDVGDEALCEDCFDALVRKMRKVVGE